MRLRIEHITTFSYDLPISEAYTEMRLAPMDLGGQRRTSFRLRTEPSGEVTRYLDRYQNEVHYFDVLQSHQQVKVTALSEVLTADAFVDEHLAEANVIVGNKLATAHALMRAVNRAIQYERGATSVKTTADEALQIGKGVCQDYAHVMLAACRISGLPARYVSGYLYSPDAPEMASHAWVDVFVTGYGWRALDPTHNCPQDEKYVRVATGRDYADVSPTRGIYKGNAKEKMEVVVQISAI
jgi:transglutaminase-like putative cysteine protease